MKGGVLFVLGALFGVALCATLLGICLVLAVDDFEDKWARSNNSEIGDYGGP